MKMMITSQMKALTDAQPQPSASSSPKRARRRGTTVPAPSARCAIVLHPRAPADRPATFLLCGQRSGHRRMHRADERVRAGLQSRDLVLAFGHSREDLALEHLGPDESLISTLWGVPASWLSKSMTKGALAGAVSSVVVNLIPWATSGTTVALALDDGATVGGGAPDPEAVGDPEAPADPEAAGRPEAAAELDGAADAVLNSSAQHAGYGVEPGAGL